MKMMRSSKTKSNGWKLKLMKLVSNVMQKKRRVNKQRQRVIIQNNIVMLKKTYMLTKK